MSRALRAMGVLLVLSGIQAQQDKDLLLPRPRHLVGVVLDPEGRPVVEAWINHTNAPRAIMTDSEGKFELDTRAPAVVIRKKGFRSEFIRTQDATEIRVILRRPGENRTLPACSNNRGSYRIEGFNVFGAFLFPRISGVKASRQTEDADYAVRLYYIDIKEGGRRIVHGSGHLWIVGIPPDRDVWQSVKYEEDRFIVGDLPIIDARGQAPNGNRWRHLAMPGESANYSGLDEATARILDRVLDGACVKTAPRR